MDEAKRKNRARQRRHRRVKKKVHGTPDRPRLSVFRSNRHIYAQIIDDTQGKVLVAISSMSAGFRDKLKKGEGKVAQGKLVGLSLATEALKKEVKKVVFDRGGYKYDGRLKAVAEGAREGGLDF